MISVPKRPLLLLVSGPSGVGKTTLANLMLAEFPTMQRSISCTTRQPRPGEKDGVDYWFVTAREFEARLAGGGFLENAVVHGHRYGTPKAKVLEAMAAGSDVLLTIDVQGAEQVRGLLGFEPADSLLRRGFVDVFIAPPSADELGRRLTTRRADSNAEIAMRLQNAGREMARWREYQYVVVNDSLESAARDLAAIVRAEHARVCHA